jgi:opacity protein-like surface antigen
MLRVSNLMVLLFGTMAVVGIPSSAQAQSTPKFEVSGGYQLLHLGGDASETLPTGWRADVAASVGPVFSAVFEVGGNYKTIEETETIAGVTATATADLRVHEFMGGGRFSARSRNVTPFAQVLVGGVHGSAKFTGTVTGNGETFFSTSGSDSSTDLGVAIGGGATFNFTEYFGFRAAIDYLRVFPGEQGVSDLNTYRFSAGVVFPF